MVLTWSRSSSLSVSSGRTRPSRPPCPLAAPDTLPLTRHARPPQRVVVGHQVSRSVSPPTANAHPNGGVGLDVSDVVGMLTVLGDHPELVAHHAAAHRGVPRLPRSAADGLEHGHRQLPAHR